MFLRTVLLMLLVSLAGCRRSDPNAAQPSGSGGADSATNTTEPGGSDNAQANGSETPARPLNGGSSDVPRGPTVYRAPQLTRMTLPSFPGRYAIWGAVGRDDRGDIWLGVSATGIETPSAHLLRLGPESGSLTDEGDVVGKLRAAGVDRDGESQMKIHSKIIQAADGRLYFTSFDETGEDERSLTYPTWGGHLWSFDLDERTWEHLLATREALIACGGRGRYVYALGYYDHVLFQFDTQTRDIRQQTVGSVGAHISRNLLVDVHEHVYVPRVQSGTASLEVALVEYDEQLEEVNATRLSQYRATPTFDSHGITAFTVLPDDSLVFTASGFLWRIVPHASQPARVEELGWIHPDGESSATSLFARGQHYVTGLVRTKAGGYEWAVFDLNTRQAAVLPFDIASARHLRHGDLLLYGTETTDDEGNAYLVGRYVDESDSKQPILLKATFWP